MIARETLANLDEDEASMLLYIVNILNKPLFDIDLGILASYNLQKLKEQIYKAGEKVKPEFWPIYEKLCNKMLVEIPERKIQP